MVLFWTIWWIIALITDLVSVFAFFNYLPPTFTHSSSYNDVISTIELYHLPSCLAPILFFAIQLWLIIICIFFIHASLNLRKAKTIWVSHAEKAFIISLCLWLTFFLADQIFLKFSLEENHMAQATFQFISYLFLLSYKN